MPRPVTLVLAVALAMAPSVTRANGDPAGGPPTVFERFVLSACTPCVRETHLKNGRLPENQRLVRIRQGEEVVLKWTADRAAVLHLHGYDLEAKVSPAAPIEMRFTTTATGWFPIELHTGTHATIGHLEVHPR